MGYYVDADGNGYSAPIPGVTLQPETPITDPSGSYTWNYQTNSWDIIPGQLPAPGSELRPGSPGTFDVNGNYNPLKMGTGSHAAADTTAAVLRGNYNEWKSKFFGKDNASGIIPQLVNQTTYANPGLVDQELSQGALRTNNAFNVASTNQAYQQQKYGMQQTTEQVQANALSLNQAKSASNADAANRIRQKLYERNQSIASGGLPAAVASGGN